MEKRGGRLLEPWERVSGAVCAAVIRSGHQKKDSESLESRRGMPLFGVELDGFFLCVAEDIAGGVESESLELSVYGVERAAWPAPLLTGFQRRR